MDNYGPVPNSLTPDVKDAIDKLVRHLDETGIKVQNVCLYII